MSVERRGRPRKLENSSPTLFEEKPREERSYKDFFPDLNIKEPLPIIKTFDSFSFVHSDLNILKSPSNDEYETASESELPPIQKSIKLPVASFKKIGEQKTNELDDAFTFQRPENHYIRYIEPSESELFETVEYDMDEQDQVWLEIYNKERQKEKLGQVSGDLFESIIDQLEKEWFDLIKSLPKKINDEPPLPEDSKCAICDDGECENSNAIVFCDGCNLAVHQDCYGIPYIPEGQWLCRKCMVSPENPVSCIFCPGEGGAFKQTTTNQWGHLLCAIWIPEVGLGNSVYMEPIDNIENVPKSRWKLTCYICKRRHGACIQCDNKNCFVAFHVTCARWARLCMRMKLHGTHYDGVVLKAFCERHSPKDYKEIVNVDKTVADAQRWFLDPKRKRDHLMPRKRYIDEEDDDAYPNLSTDDLKNNNNNDKKQRRQQAVNQLLSASKAARAHQHQYSAGAPIAPEYILDKLEKLKSVKQATHLKKKSQIVTSICRYWSLKRESRRGAPLLKRLHLEPWTASATQLKQSEVEKAHKASSMITLRADLEKLRLLSEQVQKREKLKLDRLRKQKAYLETILYPIEFVIRPILDELIEMDKKELFRYPVTKDIASDYYDIIKTPMSFADIIEKLSLHLYLSLEELADDLFLIWKNSMLYNKKDTLYYKLAQRFEKVTENLMEKARQNYQSLHINEASGLLDVEIDQDIFSYVDDSLKINTAVNKENMPEESSGDLSSSSMSTISSDSTLSMKRRISDVVDTPTKKVKSDDEHKRHLSYATRSRTESNKRSLRSRSITKDMHHPVKMGRSESLPETRKKTYALRRQSSIMSEPSNTKHSDIKKTNNHQIIKDLTHQSQSQPEPVIIINKLDDEEKAIETRKSSRNEASTHSNVPTRPKIVQLLKPKPPLNQREKQPVAEKKTSSSTIKTEQPTVNFVNGELVWARVRGFPPHPARIADPKRRRNIPKSVLSLCSEQTGKILVEFFQVSESHTWGYIEKDDIYPFGNKDIDIDMLTMAKKTKKSYRIKEVRNGYAYACGLIHIDPSPQIAAVFSRNSHL